MKVRDIHKHVSHVIKVIEEALEPYDGVYLQRTSTSSESDFGATRTEILFEIIIAHDQFEQSFEEVRQMSAESYREEFLRTLRDEA